MKSKHKKIKKWENKTFDTIIDVRSPLEYEEDHIIGSINCPVLYDQERIIVGTIYKKESTFRAKIIGSSLTARNIAKHIEEKFINQKGSWQPLIYCWRGGQRSKAFSLILSEVGWRTFQLEGGYKKYRNEVISFLNKVGSKLKIILISGKTGSAKTKILQNIKLQGGQILDLENLANHKGSLLGKIPNLKQPSQKLFESKLYHQIKQLDLRRNVYIEAESSKIGNIHIPKTLWAKMIVSPRIEIKADIELRSSFLLNDYKYMCENPELIKPIIYGLKNRLSKKLINDWMELITKKLWLDLTKSFLENHYDPSYSSNTIKNDRKVIKKIQAKSFSKEEINKITKLILN
ncbi:tRNA 2-selenouridine(34) synthase MnmH [Alphaproteobacteria bacterium]|jgi:tRNA 2-selenouridine synthase|nr:tRNA 2-selenouridine(34) synthase MnmH [Alphaproteobacteria bacterium]MDA9805975.1 tRNA 2-selenouridine(34) synthase MnmH [Alphaproteobacteria bacterium]MDA9914504.1 tRNA 2-selenouridine(34) synthase MnmH [Alphaproteobacteria bacterium]MDB2584312.1 tRNA 2-selenouridine(34) synthase MnmH [Alphaproteobacteria bacterium]